MKVRRGFVSNSSSSSFTCDVCGHTEGGYDVSLADVYMYECVNGHYFCEDEKIETEETENDKRYDDNYDVPSAKCPLCQLTALSSTEAYRYLLTKKGITEEEVLIRIKKEFKDYDEFQKFITTKK